MTIDGGERVVASAPIGSLAEQFDQLYREHARDGLRLAYVLTRDVALAEDVVQDAFVKVFVRFHNRRAPEDFRPYLRATIVNITRTRLRRGRRERSLEEADHERARSHDQAELATRADLWSAILRLPRRHRAVLYLRYVCELSERETADVLRTSVPAVKSVTLRAKRKLREVWKEEQW